MIRNGKAIDHSNVGGLWGSLIATLVSFAALVGAMVAMGYWSLDVVWVPGLIALALSLVAFMIPKTILGRTDTVQHHVVYGRPVQAQAAPAVARTEVPTRASLRGGAHAER